MFEHKSIDNQRYRVLPSAQPFLKEEVLESREPIAGKPIESTGRLQHAVIGNVLVTRYLPPESIGDRWPHDTLAEPWWEVVGVPPHGGLVAAFNAAQGGSYPRKLDPDHQVVAYAEQGEEVVIKGGTYSVQRADGKELSGSSLGELRSAYYAS